MYLDFTETFRFKGGAKKCQERKNEIELAIKRLIALQKRVGFATINDLYSELGKDSKDFYKDYCLYGWDIHKTGPIKLEEFDVSKFKLHYALRANLVDY